MSVKRIASYGMCACLALALSYLESLIPVFFAVPGMKLGLTNIVVLFALYRMDKKAALVINVVRILIAGFLFGTGISILFSLSGGVISYVVMLLMMSAEKFHMVTVSIAGAVAHNTAQILTAMFMLSTAFTWYLPVLWFSGIICGLAVGYLGYLLCSKFPPMDMSGQ